MTAVLLFSQLLRKRTIKKAVDSRKMDFKKDFIIYSIEDACASIIKFH